MEYIKLHLHLLLDFRLIIFPENLPPPPLRSSPCQADAARSDEIVDIPAETDVTGGRTTPSGCGSQHRQEGAGGSEAVAFVSCRNERPAFGGSLMGLLWSPAVGRQWAELPQVEVLNILVQYEPTWISYCPFEKLCQTVTIVIVTIEPRRKQCFKGVYSMIALVLLHQYGVKSSVRCERLSSDL